MACSGIFTLLSFTIYLTDPETSLTISPGPSHCNSREHCNGGFRMMGIGARPRLGPLTPKRRAVLLIAFFRPLPNDVGEVNGNDDDHAGRSGARPRAQRAFGHPLPAVRKRVGSGGPAVPFRPTWSLVRPNRGEGSVPGEAPHPPLVGGSESSTCSTVENSG